MHNTLNLLVSRRVYGGCNELIYTKHILYVHIQAFIVFISASNNNNNSSICSLLLKIVANRSSFSMITFLVCDSNKIQATNVCNKYTIKHVSQSYMYRVYCMYIFLEHLVFIWKIFTGSRLIFIFFIL